MDVPIDKAAPPTCIQNFYVHRDAWLNTLTVNPNLDTWYSYLCWMEHCSMSTDVTALMQQDVMRCLNVFNKSTGAINNDVRYIKIWIKYIEHHGDHLTLYTKLFNSGVGKQCARFYIAWAYYCMIKNDMQLAETVFKLGFEKAAYPPEELKLAHNQFLDYVSRQALYNDKDTSRQEKLIWFHKYITTLRPYDPPIPPDISPPPMTHHNVQGLHPHPHGQGPPQPASHSTPTQPTGPPGPGVQQPPQPPHHPVSHSYGGHPHFHEQYQPQYPPPPHSFAQYHDPYYPYQPQQGPPPPYVAQPVPMHAHSCWYSTSEPIRGPPPGAFMPYVQNQPGTPSQHHTGYIESSMMNNHQSPHMMAQHQHMPPHHTHYIASQYPNPEHHHYHYEHHQHPMHPHQTHYQHTHSHQPLPQHQQQQQQQQQQTLQPQQHQPPQSQCTAPVETCINDDATYDNNNSPDLFIIEPPVRPPIVIDSSDESNPGETSTASKVNDDVEQPSSSSTSLTNDTKHRINNKSTIYADGCSTTTAAVTSTNGADAINSKEQGNKHCNHRGVIVIRHQSDDDMDEDPTAPLMHETTEATLQFKNSFDAGIYLPSDFKRRNQPQDEWSVVLYVDDPEDAHKTRCYQTHNVYPDDGTEHSLEELKSAKFFNENPHKKFNVIKEVPQQQQQTTPVRKGSSCKVPKQVIRLIKGKLVPNKFKMSSAPQTPISVPSSSDSNSNEENCAATVLTPCSSMSFSDDTVDSDELPLAAIQYHLSANANAKSTPVSRKRKSKAGGRTNAKKMPRTQCSILTSRASNLSSAMDDSMASENSFLGSDRLFEESREVQLEKANKVIEEHMGKDTIDPFHRDLCKALLVKVNFPAPNHDEYKMVPEPLPKLTTNRKVKMNKCTYFLEKEIGRGSYGQVYKAQNTEDAKYIALKYQRPANMWEAYICSEVKQRITNQDMLPGYLDVKAALVGTNASIYISELGNYGSLLDIYNTIRFQSGIPMRQPLAMHFTQQILSIVDFLHSCQIIHADIKPDNFLLMKLPNDESHVPTLRLIDFGSAIDMTLFPPGTQFTKEIGTDSFTCTEMKEGRPWSYQTDLYCIASSVYLLIMGHYMTVVKRSNMWQPKTTFPRYLEREMWTQFFKTLLNIETVEKKPDLKVLKRLIDVNLEGMKAELQNDIRQLNNYLHKR